MGVSSSWLGVRRTVCFCIKNVAMIIQQEHGWVRKDYLIDFIPKSALQIIIHPDFVHLIFTVYAVIIYRGELEVSHVGSL